MALVAVPSVQCELAVKRVNEALAVYRDASTTSVMAGLPSPRLFLKGGSHARQLAEATLLRLVAIAENYAMSALALDAESQVEKHDFGSRLWRMVDRRLSDTWAGSIEGWERLFGLKLKTAASGYERLEGYIDARNTIAHGLGVLTRRQMGNRNEIVGRLQSIGITVQGDAIIVEIKDVDACAGTVQAFVSWLDTERGRLRGAVLV